MQVQPQPQHRHQDRGQQRQRLAQAGNPTGIGTFSIGQQFTGSFVTTGAHLRRIEHAFGLLRLQLGHALLVKRHVQRGTILFALGATAPQHRDQQKTQGNQ
ncbi:hypothetical protein D3C84_1040480 [compost metagenome]